MEKRWWMKFAFLMVCVLTAIAYVAPTLTGTEKSWFPYKKRITLGLDLQGGLYMVMGVDFNQVFKEILERQASSLEGRLTEKKLVAKSVKVARDGYPADDPRIIVEYDAVNRDAIHKLLKDEFWTLRLTGDEVGKFELAISHDYRKDVRKNTIDQSIEVIRNRIDEFGVAEPSITSQGNDRVVIELPGVRDIDRAKGLIGRTAKLEFKIVDDKGMDPGQVATIVADAEKATGIDPKDGQHFSEYVKKVNEFAKGKIPDGDEISFERETDFTGKTLSLSPYLLISKSEVTGQELEDAQVRPDPDTNRPLVSFRLNPRGAALFDKLTGESVGKRLAIVLDGIVHSAPVIQGRIPGGSGQITLGQGDYDTAMKEAKDLAIVLRAGALPAQLEFLEQRVVGPSLGEDSIKKGSMAGLVGALGIFLFTLFYYRVSGAIAVFSLILNVLFTLAVLAGLEATLTLPGIAGIALTVGIAVDSNVVIYERIREELGLGKSIRGAVTAGFDKAFRTILDANVTNAAAALVLLSYGTGAVKGFAVTMMIGILATMFSAVFVCKLVFDAYLVHLESRQSKTLSI